MSLHATGIWRAPPPYTLLLKCTRLLGQRAPHQQVQKLLQAERRLKFLVAKQSVASARDAALGFVFKGPRLNAAAAVRPHATLAHDRVVLPRLWELVGQPGESRRPVSPLSCRVLAYLLKPSKPAITAMQLEALGRVQEETRALGRMQEETRARAGGRESADPGGAKSSLWCLRAPVA